METMKHYIELLITGLFSIAAALLMGALVVGSYRRQIDINTSHLADIELNGSRALQAQVVEFHNLERRVSETENQEKTLVQMQVTLGQISEKITDIQDRTRRLEAKP